MSDVLEAHKLAKDPKKTPTGPVLRKAGGRLLSAKAETKAEKTTPQTAGGGRTSGRTTSQTPRNTKRHAQPSASKNSAYFRAPPPRSPSVAPSRQGALRTLEDPQGFYRALGISPNATFLDPKKEVQVNMMLNIQRKEMAKRHKDDLGSGAGSSTTMSVINAAYDRVKTRM